MDHSAPTPFSVAVESMNGNAVVVLAGELDMDTAPQLIRILEPLVEKGPTEIVLDFSGVTFVDSSGIAVLVGSQNQLSEQGRRIRVRAPRPQALRVFEVTGLTGFMGSDRDAAPKADPDSAVTNP
jgi:anti-sigma B factor antagonist